MATESLILEYDFKDNASQKTNLFTQKLNKLAEKMGITTKSMNQIDKGSKKVKDGFDKVTNSSSSLFKKMTSLKGIMVTLGGLFAATKIKGWITSWINLSAVQQENESQLKNTLVVMGKYTDQYYNSMLKTASALQKVTQYGDEAIISVQNTLLRFDSITSDIMPRVTRLTLDMAKALGTDLGNASKMMGRALSGDVTLLKRFGLEIDKSLFEKQGAVGIMDFMESKVGGAASVDSWTKIWKSLGNVIGDVKEKFGDFFNKLLVDGGVIDHITSKITEMIDNITNFMNSSIFDDWISEKGQRLKNYVSAITSMLEISFKLLSKFDLVIKGLFVGASIATVSKLLSVFKYGESFLGGAKGVSGESGRVVKILNDIWTTLRKIGTSIVGGTVEVAGATQSLLLKFTQMFAGGAIIAAITAPIIHTLLTRKGTEESRAKISKEHGLDTTTDIPEGWLNNMDSFNDKLKLANDAGEDLYNNWKDIDVIIKMINSEIPMFQEDVSNLSHMNFSVIESEEIILNFIKYIEDSWGKTIDTMTTKFNDAFSGMLQENQLDYAKFSKDIMGMFSKNVTDMISSRFITPVVENMAEIIIQKYFGKEFIEEASVQDIIERFKSAIPQIRSEMKKALNELSIEIIPKNKELTEGISADWKKTVDTITTKFNDAFSGMLQGNKLDFEKFSEDIIGIFSKNVTDMISSRLITPLVEKLSEDIIGENFGEDFLKNASTDEIIAKFKEFRDVFPEIETKIEGVLNKLGIFKQEARNPMEWINPYSRLDYSGIVEQPKPIFPPLEEMTSIELPDEELDNFSKKLADLLRDSIKEGLRTGLMDRGQLRKNIRGLFTDKLADEFSKNLGNGISKFMGIDTGIPIGGGETMSFGSMVGVGAGMYNMQKNKEQLGTFGGAMAGASIGSVVPGIGTAIGAGAGAIYGMANNDKEKEVTKSVDLMWESIDGRIKLVGETWKNMDRDSGLIDTVKESVKAMYTFYKDINYALNKEIKSFSLFTKGGDKPAIQQDLIKQSFGQLYDLFGDSLLENIDIIMGGIDPTRTNFSTFLKELTDSMGITKELKEPRSDYAVDMQDKLLSAMITPELAEELYKEYSEVFINLSKLVSSSISSGFSAAIKSKDFKLFFSTVRSNLAQTIVNNVLEAVTSTLYNKLLPTLGNMSTIIDKYTTGDMSIEDLTAEVSTNFAKSSQIIADMEPVFNAVAEGMSSLTSVINENTESNWENNRLMVDELLSRKEMIEDFIRDMRGGEQAPTRSIDWMEQEYESLLSGAMKGDSDDLSKLLDYVSGTYLPFMETASSNYDDTFEKVMDEIEAMKPSDELLSKELQTLIDMLSELDDQTELMQEYIEILKGIEGEAMTNSPENKTREDVEEATSSREEQQDWAKLYIEDQKANGVGQNFRSFVAEQKELNSQPLHIHLDVDGREIASVLIDQSNTNPDMAKLLGGR